MALRIIQVGLGGWGRNWIKTIVTQNKDVELVAGVDTVPEMLSLAQKELTIGRYFTSLDEALTAVDADAVLITASLEGHVPVALAALDAGKHVLLEKPFAPTLADAQRVVARAEEQERILMISQNYRYFPATRAVQKLIQEGTLGPIGSVNLNFRRYANTPPRGGSVHHRLWQPLLVDMAIHHFDLMRMLLGKEPTRIMCQTWNPSWSNFVEAAEGSALITFEDGTVVTYSGSWVSTAPQTNWAGEWRIECEGGEILATSRGDKPDYVAIRPPGKRLRTLKLPEVPLIDRHGTLAAFVKAVQTGEEPETSGRRNLKTLALMLAAVEAARTGNPVNINGE
ncbi:MAG: Gfo/Idh/MocA family oxidoreductase [Ktedonobacteraceae bacterium]|nr:Gfo/Idh/MocA family oxidoreductase [Ktedonobacteraceae bacterium]